MRWLARIFEGCATRPRNSPPLTSPPSRGRIKEGVIDPLRQYLFRTPLVDRRPIITENFPKDLVIVGAEPIGQPERPFSHSSKQNPAAGNFKRADQGVWKRGEVVSVAQLRVLEKIGAGLNHAGWNSRRLELRHHLLGALRFCPLLCQSIQLRGVLRPRCAIHETSIVDESFLADDATEAAPFIIVSDGNHAPTIFALATIAAVRCRLRITVPLRLRIMTIDGGIQVGHAERVGRPLDLREIDGYTLPR